MVLECYLKQTKSKPFSGTHWWSGNPALSDPNFLQDHPSPLQAARLFSFLLLFHTHADAQKFTPWFPGRGNGISGRGRCVGAKVPLPALNTPQLSVAHFFSSFSLCPKVSWNHAGCSCFIWFSSAEKDAIPAFGLSGSNSQASCPWSCHKPLSPNLESGRQP